MNYKNTEARRQLDSLERLGFEFEITVNGYTVRRYGAWIAGASVMLPRRKPLRGLQGRKNIEGFTETAISIAKRSLVVDLSTK